MKKNYQCVLAALFVLLFSNLSFAENEDPCAMPTTLTKSGEVYQIGTCGDLYKFAEMVSSGDFDDNINGKLIADICVNACGEGESVLNADGTLNGDGGNFKQWTPMDFLPGYDMLDVQVTLDGNGKTISGLYVDDISTENVGLFGVVTGMVFVSDLGIEDSYFKGKSYVGGLVGYSSGTFSITNSYNAGTVSGSDNSVGGLVGYSSGTLTITNSYNAGAVSGNGYVGGLVGFNNEGTLTITNSFFLAAEGVSGEFGGTPKSATEFHIGLVALMLHNYVQTGCGNDCIDGTIWGQNLKNGDLRPNFSSVINVETQELVLHTFEDDTRVYPTEYIAGQELPTDLTREGFVFLGWSSKEVAESSDDIVTSIASDATGKKEFYAQWKAFDGEGCFAIASTVELYAFANVVGSATDGKQICGTLAENIVVNTCDDGKSVLKGDGSLNCSGEKFKQWTPMNVQSGVQVTFNGKGKTISGLYFDNGNKENVGLFGGVYGTVDISNLNIVDSYFKGKNGVGGLVGYSSGTLTIANSYNAGSVSGTDNVGGLVGANKYFSTLTITSSYNAGSVSGNDNVGGLVGFNNGGTLTVTNSYNVGAVSGSNVGGLVGANEYYYSTLTIAHSFFLATRQSGDGLGGEVKALDEFHDGTVAALLHYYVQTDCEENCIDGSVWGQDLTNVNSMPDFSGEFAGGTLYALTLYTFDGNARKYPTEYVSEIGLELPTDLVRDGYVFAGWSTKQVSTSMADIVTSIAKGSTGDKEFYAQWMKVSEEGVYEIATAADLYKFAQLVNGVATDINGKLTANICVNACGEGESVLNADGTLNGNGSNFTPWTPIGTETQKFNGTFDGAGHTISGLYVDGAEYAGLFGYVFVDNINGEDEKGVVKNVGIEDSYISGTNYVGGVVAYNEGRTLSVYNAGNVTGSGFGCATGGVVGYNVGLVSEAYNAGAVKSSVNDCSTGGVVGLNAGFVFYVYNIGAVSGGANVGGVAGSNSSMISKAYYNTEIFTGNAVGSGNQLDPAAGKTAVELSSLEIVDLVSDKDHVGSSAWVVGSGRIVMSANKLVYKLPGLKVFSTQPEIVLMQANDQNVFEIGSAQELKGFAEYAGSGEISINAKLTADICLNACGEGKSVLKADGTLNGDAANFEQWTPINTRYGTTNVSFDGNGHTISGLYFSNSEQDNVGLFGKMEGIVSISNLGIVDSYFEGHDNVGVFAGQNTNSNLTIANCFGAGSVEGNDYVAGFVGDPQGGLSIANSYSVSIVNGKDGSAGGFIGSNIFKTIANSFFLNGSSDFGGTQKTADEFHDGTVAMLLHNWCEKDDGSENCKEGGLDGTVWGQDLTNANSLPDFSSKVGTPYSLTLRTFDEDVRKYPTEYVSEIGLELPTDLVREGYVFAGWSTKQVSTSMADIVTSIAKGATGAKTFYAQWMKVSEEGVYEIATAVDLYKFAQLVNGGATDIKGKLTADICVNACGEGEKSLLEQVAELEAKGKLLPESFKQWTPIGTTGKNKMFNGTFDGAGHTISGLYFNDGKASYAGLFGRSTKNNSINSIKSSIKNVGVVDSYIKGKNYVGGIVGYNGNCTVSNVFSTSTVEGSMSTVEGSTSTVEEGTYVGGIAGYNDAGTIENAYNMGAVSGAYRVGGIAGENHGTTAHINNVYSSGTVSLSYPKGQYVKGLVGYNESKMKIDNAYYNTDVFLGMAVGNVDGTNVEGKTTVELASTTLPEGFSSEIWLAGSKDVVDGKLVYKFPGLNIFNSQPELVLFNVQKGSDGKDYCEIANADDLFKFAQLVNGGATGLNAKLTADICVNGCGEGEKSLLEQVAELEANDELSPESFQRWTPMNVSSNVTLTFDGNGHTISGLYFNKEKSSQIGLFGQVVGDVSVSNLGVVDFYVNGNGEVGSLAGQVTGKLNIKNCYSAGSVKGEHYIGGIVGVNRDVAELKIENSYNESSVNAPSGIVGGLVGENNNYASLTIANSYNAGAVNGNDYVGGLVGDNYSAILTIENSYNAGTVSGDSCVGGLVGVNEDGTLNVLNSFFVETNGDGDGLAGEAKTSDEFADGTVALLLHDWCEKEDGNDECKVDGLNGSIWGQDVMKEYSLPNFSDSVLSFKRGGVAFFYGEGNDVDSAYVDAASESSVKFDDNVVVNGPTVFKRTFSGNGYSTIMLPFTPDCADNDCVEGVKFFEFNSYTDGEVQATEVSPKDLKANTPYLVQAAGATELVFKNGGTFNTTTGEAYNSETGEYKVELGGDGAGWSIYGTYAYKTWEKGDAGLGRTYGFAANDGVNDESIVGKFAKIAAGAYIYPMRAYLEYDAPVALARPAANGEVRTLASLPETINVVIIDKGDVEIAGDSSSEETTTYIGTINTRTGEFKFANDRWFDLQGRYLGVKKPTQKGAYYNNGKKVIVK